MKKDTYEYYKIQIEKVVDMNSSLITHYSSRFNDHRKWGAQ